MNPGQILEMLRDHLGDLQRREDAHAARYIEQNPTDRQRRQAYRDAYTAALLDVHSAISQLNHMLKEAR